MQGAYIPVNLFYMLASSSRLEPLISDLKKGGAFSMKRILSILLSVTLVLSLIHI